MQCIAAAFAKGAPTYLGRAKLKSQTPSELRSVSHLGVKWTVLADSHARSCALS